MDLVNNDKEYQLAKELGINTKSIVMFHSFINLMFLFSKCKNILFAANSGMHNFFGAYVDKRNIKSVCLISEYDIEYYSYKDVKYVIVKKGELREKLYTTMKSDEVIKEIKETLTEFTTV